MANATSETFDPGFFVVGKDVDYIFIVELVVMIVLPCLVAVAKVQELRSSDMFANSNAIVMSQATVYRRRLSGMSTKRPSKRQTRVKVGVLLYNAGFLISSAVMLALYTTSHCRWWYSVYNIYYVLNSVQLYRFLLNRAKLVDGMKEYKQWHRVQYVLVHFVHLIGAGSLAIVSAASPMREVTLSDGSNACVSDSPPWMWYALLALDSVISLSLWAMFLFPLCMSIRMLQPSIRTMIYRNMILASIAFTSTMTYMILMAYYVTSENNLLCETVVSLGIADLCINFFCVMLSYNIKGYVMAYRDICFDICHCCGLANADRVPGVDPKKYYHSDAKRSSVPREAPSSEPLPSFIRQGTDADCVEMTRLSMRTSAPDASSGIDSGLLSPSPKSKSSGTTGETRVETEKRNVSVNVDDMDMKRAENPGSPQRSLATSSSDMRSSSGKDQSLPSIAE